MPWLVVSASWNNCRPIFTSDCILAYGGHELEKRLDKKKKTRSVEQVRAARTGMIVRVTADVSVAQEGDRKVDATAAVTPKVRMTTEGDDAVIIEKGKVGVFDG